MIKKLTGIIFDMHEFKKLNECIQCGKAQKIKKDTICEKCINKNIPKCKMCEILLRSEEEEIFTYDCKDSHREGMKFKPIVKDVREFSYKSKIIESKDGLCNRCIDWRKRKKNMCFNCDGYFENTDENYKLNGNLCRFCVPMYSKYSNFKQRYVKS